jgi:predicted nucleic acid-binding protein
MIDIWNATQKIPVDLRSIDIPKALEIAAQFNIYAYDAYFLTCALSLRSPLITLDNRMNEVAMNLGIRIVEVNK